MNFVLFACVRAFLSVANPAFAAFADIWAGWLPDAASPVKVEIHHFNALLNTIIAVIVTVVTILLFFTLFRYTRRRNPVPSQDNHNVKLEIIWTLIPCIILLIIIFPSLRMMYFMDRTIQPDMTLKVVGYQWYWGYSYPDQELEEFQLHMVPDQFQDPKEEFAALRAAPTYQRLLSTYDLASGAPAFVVLPVQKNIRILVTANDVLHSFAMPAFGIKKDAVPGRLNETWVNVTRPGIYYGQCSEICGINHAYMPIEIRAVEEEQFNTWVEMMKEDQAGAMAYIQEITVDYAHPQVVATRLRLMDLWTAFTGLFK